MDNNIIKLSEEQLKQMLNEEIHKRTAAEEKYDNVVGEVDGLLMINDHNICFKIDKIDKSYKESKKSLIEKSIISGATIALFAYMFLKVNPNIEFFDIDSLKENCDNYFVPMLEKMNILNLDNLTLTVYTASFNFVQRIINSIGQSGIIVASSALAFILNCSSNTIKTLKIRKELNELQQKLENLRDFKKNFDEYHTR